MERELGVRSRWMGGILPNMCAGRSVLRPYKITPEGDAGLGWVDRNGARGQTVFRHERTGQFIDGVEALAYARRFRDRPRESFLRLGARSGDGDSARVSCESGRASG